MVRCGPIIFLIMVLIAVPLSTLSVSAAGYVLPDGINLYGFPISINPSGSGSPLSLAKSASYNNVGLELPQGVSTRYGIVSSEFSPGYQESSPYGGYFGPQWNGVRLGVSFGFPSVTHDYTNTIFAKDMAYEASVDNAFIGFPGLGVGSMGLGFPRISSNKATIRYAESIKFQLITESDQINFGGFGYPLGLGLGYTSAQVDGAQMGMGSLGMPFYYGAINAINNQSENKGKP